MENFSPKVFNLFKPAGVTSYDIIRKFKRSLPKDATDRIGHFGTLDPFACGVLLVGVAGASRINDYIHNQYSKTYLVVGKLGQKTDSGDITGEVVNFDDSEYLKNTISSFSKDFINLQLQQKFLGSYLQAPPAFSATKFQGKALHKWAREGVIIKKEPVQRVIHAIEVVKYSYPYLSIRFEVSSGTYIRTLFEDCCQWLGTIGTSIALVRESVGPHCLKSSLNLANYPEFSVSQYNQLGLDIDQALLVSKIELNDFDSKLYRNGASRTIKEAKPDGIYWVYHQNELIGLGKMESQNLKVLFNLRQ